MSPNMWDQGIAWFAQAGFNQAEAVGWLTAFEEADRLPDRRSGFLAREYLDTGFTADGAAVWSLTGSRPTLPGRSPRPVGTPTKPSP